MLEKLLITFAMMAHNDARFVAAAFAAALAQSYQPLEIIVSDDCSTDNTLEIIEQIAAAYRGPHTVLVNRNEENLGLSMHINRIMELCRGEIVVIAAADDISVPNRVQRSYDAFLASGGKAFSIHSSCVLIDDCGATIGSAQEYESYDVDLETVIEQGTWLYGCTHAWRREIFDRFGPLPAEVTREDEVLPFRSLLLGTVGYVREPLVLYRLHEKNISRWNRRMARNATDLNEHICRQLRERVVNLRSYLADLERAGSLVDRERGRALRERLESEIECREKELTLRSGSAKEKMAMLRRSRSGFDPVLAAKVLLRILCPGAYLRYGYRRYRKIAGSDVEELPRSGPARRIAPQQKTGHPLR